MKELIHIPTGIIGTFIKAYKPTGKLLTIQINTVNGIYFAPFNEFESCI